MALSPSVVKLLLEITGSSDLNMAVKEISKDAVEHRLEKIESEIRKFEEKYGMTFEEFKEAWEKGEVENKHSYEVEKDFWEWEGLISRKKKLKEVLKWLG